MELFVYREGWAMPSIDIECIRLMTVIKMTSAPITINRSGNPFRSPNSQLPYLWTGNEKISGYDRIVNYLKKQGYDPNKNLANDEERFLYNSYIAYVQDKLFPMIQYILWGDPKNQEDTRMMYAKRTPFPFNFYYPKQYLKRADLLFNTLAGFISEDKFEEHRTDEFLMAAKICINSLESKLVNKKYFSGKNLCEFDAIAYAYLLTMLNAPLPSNPLQSHIRECPNIVRFLGDITRNKFSDMKMTSNTIYLETQQTDKSSDDTAMSKHTVQFLSFLGATGAMLIFAFMNGMLEFGDHGLIRRAGIYNYDDEDLDDEEEY